MKFLTISIFIVLTFQGIAQPPKLYSISVNASRPAAPFYVTHQHFKRLAPNEVIVIAQSQDTLLVSLMDTCGAVLASNQLLWSEKGSMNTKRFKSLKLDNGHYVLAAFDGVTDISTPREMLYYLDENLKLIRAYRFSDKSENKPEGYIRSADWSFVSLEEGKKSAEFLFLGQGVGSEIWKVDLNSGLSEEWSLAHISPNKQLDISGLYVQNDKSILLSGNTESYGVSRPFMAKLTKDLTLEFYHEYALKDHDETLTEHWSQCVYAMPDGKIYSFLGGNALENIGTVLVEFQQFGKVVSAQSISAASPANPLHIDLGFRTFKKMGNSMVTVSGNQYGSSFIVHNSVNGMRLYHMPREFAPSAHHSLSTPLVDPSSQEIEWKISGYPHLTIGGLSVQKRFTQPCVETKEVSASFKTVGWSTYSMSTDSVVFTQKSHRTVVSSPEVSKGLHPKWTLVETCPTQFSNTSVPAQHHYKCTDTVLLLQTRFKGDSFIWNTGDSLSTLFTDSTGQFVCTVSDGFCTVVDTQYISNIDTHDLTLQNDTSVCPKSTINLVPNKTGFSFALEWTLPDERRLLANSVIAEDSGLYRVRVEGIGCGFFDSVLIEYFTAPHAIASPDSKICKGDTITLYGDGGETYFWTPADFLDNDRLKNPKAFPPNTQLYRVVVTSKEGCHDTDFVNLQVNPKPIAGFLPMPANASIADKGVLFSNLGSNSSGYKWFVNQTEQTQEANFNFLFPDTGSFQIMLRATNQEGCSDSALWQLRVDPAPLMFIPNAFTPNGDGLNDVFAPSSFYYEQYEMTIFSKTGQRIWKSRDSSPFPVWDARLDKSLETVPIGTYLYIIKGKSQDGDEYEFSGKVHVVK